MRATLAQSKKMETTSSFLGVILSWSLLLMLAEESDESVKGGDLV